MPASARIYAPEQTLAMRTPRFSMARTKPRVFWHLAAVRTPQPPATIKVVIAPAGLRPRAPAPAGRGAARLRAAPRRPPPPPRRQRDHLDRRRLAGGARRDF